MSKEIELIGEAYGSKLGIKFNTKNVVFACLTDNTGDTFTISKKELLEHLNGENNE